MGVWEVCHACYKLKNRFITHIVWGMILLVTNLLVWNISATIVMLQYERKAVAQATAKASTFEKIGDMWYRIVQAQGMLLGPQKDREARATVKSELKE